MSQVVFSGREQTSCSLMCYCTPLFISVIYRASGKYAVAQLWALFSCMFVLGAYSTDGLYLLLDGGLKGHKFM